ncbi:MAG: hypothetical protein K2Q10_02345, partial [Rhodospirillales bacterium]|nr:hypothetical protein [Rhodospirillales bacterium]
MLVLVVSECAHAAWPRTREIVDAYLERAGERTWRGRLTQDGLERLRQELAAVATRQTSVAASVVVGRLRFELEWIVGSAKPFGEDGQCVTYGGNAYDRYFVETVPRPEPFGLLSSVCGMSGLWHDVGKANSDFLDKLRHGRAEADPIRHEILSNLVFTGTMRQLLAAGSLDRDTVKAAILRAIELLPSFTSPEDRIDLAPADLPVPL